MNKLKKIIRYSLFGVLSCVIIFIIIVSLIAVFLGYDKVHRFIPDPYKITCLKHSTIKKINIESLYKDKLFADSIYLLKYGDSCKIAVWIIEQNQNVSLNNSIDTNQKILKPDDLIGDFYTYPDSKLTLESKMFLHDFKNIAVYFNDCDNIQNIINNKNCIYYHLKLGEIYLASDGRNYYDIKLDLSNYSDADFMIYVANNKLYIFLLYSPFKIKINPGELLSIINFSLT